MVPPMPHDADEPSTTDPYARTRTNRPPPGRMPADEEAVRLMANLLERAQVARSFAKLAGGLLAVSATQASLQLRAVADAKLAEMMRVARAVKDAAVHVATQGPEHETEVAPETQNAPVVHHAAE